MTEQLFFYFGNRVVGTLSLNREECSGIGVEIYERGLDVLSEHRHYSPTDGAVFLDAVRREFQGEYFRVV